MSIEEKLKQDFFLRIDKSESHYCVQCIASLYCQFKRFQRRVYFEHLFRICYVANTGLYLGLNDVDQSRFRGNWDFAKKGERRPRND